MKAIGALRTLKSFIMLAVLSLSYLAVATYSNLKVVKNEEKILAYIFGFNFARLIVS